MPLVSLALLRRNHHIALRFLFNFVEELTAVYAPEHSFDLSVELFGCKSQKGLIKLVA